MKKFLIGCGVILLVLLVIVGLVSWKLYQLATETLQEAAEIAKEGQTLDKDFPFTPEQGQLLTAERLDAWLETRNKLAIRFSQVEDSLKDGGIGVILKFREELFEVVSEHIAALRTVSMSVDEYMWITAQVLGALNSGDGRSKPEMKELVKAVDDLEKNQQRGLQTQNIRLMAAPVTAEQIANTCNLLAQRKEQFLSSIKAFFADIPVSEGTAYLRKRESPSDGAGRAVRTPDI
ncbi:hypothetical protein ACFL1X_11690 [Candidatus Hydrogenedentota bacterium]